MTDFLSIGEIDSRRRRIGVEAKDLYTGAGVSQPTWNRAVQGSPGTRTGALIQLTEALVAKELHLLEYLAKLHPDKVAELAQRLKKEEAA